MTPFGIALPVRLCSAVRAIFRAKAEAHEQTDYRSWPVDCRLWWLQHTAETLTNTEPRTALRSPHTTNRSRTFVSKQGDTTTQENQLDGGLLVSPRMYMPETDLHAGCHGCMALFVSSAPQRLRITYLILLHRMTCKKTTKTHLSLKFPERVSYFA